MHELPWEAIYAAGFFDGEGCISAGVDKRGISHLSVQITQLDIRPLLFLQGLYGGGIHAERHCWQLNWSGRTAIPFLESIEPYLQVKREQVILGLEFISHIAPRGGPHTLSQESKNRRIEIVGELKGLKLVRPGAQG